MNSDQRNVKDGEENNQSPLKCPSPVFTALKLKVCNEQVVSKELPSNNIAELWEKPLKCNDAFASSSSGTPQGQQSQRSFKRNDQKTPSSRRNILPPTKLFGDLNTENSPSLKLKRVAYRRSMSQPEAGSYASGRKDYPNSKRIKLFADENSPYEELCTNGKPTDATVNSATVAPTETAPSLANANSTLTPMVKKLFLKSQSDSILSSPNVKTSLENRESNPYLIGDASRSYVLPLMSDGKHPDLKEITSKTLANLIKGETCGKTIVYKIIDCRYPYEYEGGHIDGAVNLYTKKQIEEVLLDTKIGIDALERETTTCEDAREILIFHCEFSSQRGPDLCRHLRKIDRDNNLDTYPKLFYPELYVLYGGYKEFFSKFPSLCQPQSYTEMRDLQFQEEYRRFRTANKHDF